jgi:hypothetical protein
LELTIVKWFSWLIVIAILAVDVALLAHVGRVSEPRDEEEDWWWSIK